MLETQNPMIALDKAIELSQIVTNTHGNVLLFNTVVPMVTPTGVLLSKDAQEEKQTKVNKSKGLLVVQSNHPDNVIGTYVALRPQTSPLFSKVITTNELIEGLTESTIKDLKAGTGNFAGFNAQKKDAFYKKYVIILVHPTDIVCTIDLTKLPVINP